MGRPLMLRAARSAEGPGMGQTGMSASMAALTSW